MKHLFVIITNNINRIEIDYCKSSWIGSEDHLFLGDTNIEELNMLGFQFDNGVSYNINNRIFNFFVNKINILKKYNWITFLDDTSYVFLNNFFIELENRLDGKIPRIIGSDYFFRCDFFNDFKKNDEIVFDLKNGISINSCFVEKTINFINSLKNDHRFLSDGILNNEIFFNVISEKISAKKHFSKNRLYINYMDNIEEVFKNLSIISGLNYMEKNIINKKN